MRHFVGREEYAGHGEKSCAKEIGEGVVFFLEEERGCVGDTWRGLVDISIGGFVMMRRETFLLYVRVSGMMVTFFSPSPRRKSSNLST